MTKSFLTYTAIIEGLTGLALILLPAKTALLLFNAVLSEPVGIIMAMVGGAAILSLSLGAWLVRIKEDTDIPLKMLLFYNASVSLILLYGVLELGFEGIVLWAVIIFHFFQTGMTWGILRKNRAVKKSNTKL